jgi:hypothetical protein
MVIRSAIFTMASMLICCCSFAQTIDVQPVPEGLGYPPPAGFYISKGGDGFLAAVLHVDRWDKSSLSGTIDIMSAGKNGELIQSVSPITGSITQTEMKLPDGRSIGMGTHLSLRITDEPLRSMLVDLRSSITDSGIELHWSDSILPKGLATNNAEFTLASEGDVGLLEQETKKAATEDAKNIAADRALVLTAIDHLNHYMQESDLWLKESADTNVDGDFDEEKDLYLQAKKLFSNRPEPIKGHVKFELEAIKVRLDIISEEVAADATYHQDKEQLHRLESAALDPYMNVLCHPQVFQDAATDGNEVCDNFSKLVSSSSERREAVSKNDEEFKSYRDEFLQKINCLEERSDDLFRGVQFSALTCDRSFDSVQ